VSIGNPFGRSVLALVGDTYMAILPTWDNDSNKERIWNILFRDVYLIDFIRLLA